MLVFLIITTFTFNSIFAHPGYLYEHKLQTVPSEESYAKIEFPKLDIIEFGEYKKHYLPPKIIQITKNILIKEPKPYPVKVPHHVPYPVIHKVPYPVVNKEIVQVPEPVPYPVVQTVHVPVEVPKPYPVPTHELERSPSVVGHSGFENDASDMNEVEPFQNDENSLIKGENIDQGSWKPLGVEQYQHLNQYIQHQMNYRGDVQSQNYSEERPVHEEQQDN